MNRSFLPLILSLSKGAYALLIAFTLAYLALMLIEAAFRIWGQ